MDEEFTPTAKAQADNTKSQPTDEAASYARISPPWLGVIDAQRAAQMDQRVQSRDPSVIDQFIRQRSDVHALYIREEAKTKRLWLVLAVASMLIALVILVFAPAGRETLSYWIGGALLIFAAGAAGYKRVWGKGPGVSVGADQDKRTL